MNYTPFPSRMASFLRYTQVVILLSILFYFGSTLFVPMCYGLLIAIVLYPVCKWLEARKWPRSVAITTGLSFVVILFGLLLTLLILQLQAFRKDLPEILLKVQPYMVQLQEWLQSSFGFTIAQQEDWRQNVLHTLANNTGGILRGTISATASVLFNLFLVPVYAALFLYNREAFVEFLEKLAGNKYHNQLRAILSETIHTYFHFIKGMIQVYLIVGVLNSIGLLALGIDHAILFGMLTAVMTIIPYIGIFVSALLPVSIAWITNDSIWYPVAVIGVFSFVQYLEANVIFPRVVASQLKVTTWATLVAIIAGGLLWGVSGMILFIPFVGILRIVTDYIPEWKALNILLSRK